MTAFDINHNGYLELNEQLYQCVGNLGAILDNLNNTLRNIPEAVQGNAETLWTEQQVSWNANYDEMTTKLNADSLRSIDVHEIFKGGDYTSTNIMSQ